MYIREEDDDEVLPPCIISDIAAAAEEFFNVREDLLTPLHITASPTLEPYAVKQGLEEGPACKPKGLWYGIGPSWAEWAYYNMPDMIKPYIFKLELNKKKMLVIESVRELDAFEKIHKVEHPVVPRMSYIDWQKVAGKYMGIQIAPYLWQRRMHSFWYYGWDCASGCIWTPAAIKSVKLYAKYDETKKKYIPTSTRERC